jgi:magnesium chelatase subunit I
MEFLLHGLSEFSLLSKEHIASGLKFSDMLSSMFSIKDEEDDSDGEENYY